MSENVAKGAPRETTIVVELEAARWRHLFWGAFGMAVGAIMFLRMGQLGWVLGTLVIVLSFGSARAFVMTLLHAPGTIAVRDNEVVLPEQLSSGASVTVPLQELRHAYLLRRALPLNHAGPVLVVETNRGVFQYPRDWFTGENDQKRVSQTINRRLGRIA